MRNGTSEDWITALEGAGATGTGTVALELSFLSAQGYTSGTLDDRWYAYLAAKGYTGALQDMWNAAEAADDLLATSFDIDSIYGVSDGGDFYISGTDQFTDAGTTPATSNGDLIRQWNGQRSAGSSIIISQGTAASRPELAADATYTQSTYWPGGALKWISQETFNSGIVLWGVRFRLNAIGAGSLSDRGLAFLSSDFSPIVNGFGVAEARNIRVDGAAGGNGSVIADTDWHTLVVSHDGTDFKIYLDDMTTADATVTTSLGALLNFRTGFNTTFSHGALVHKMMAHTTWDAATPAELATWLEAA